MQSLVQSSNPTIPLIPQFFQQSLRKLGADSPFAPSYHGRKISQRDLQTIINDAVQHADTQVQHFEQTRNEDLTAVEVPLADPELDDHAKEDWRGGQGPIVLSERRLTPKEGVPEAEREAWERKFVEKVGKREAEIRGEGRFTRTH